MLPGIKEKERLGFFRNRSFMWEGNLCIVAKVMETLENSPRKYSTN